MKRKTKKLKLLIIFIIKKNKYKCKIIYKNKMYELKEYYEDFDLNNNNKVFFQLKLIYGIYFIIVTL